MDEPAVMTYDADRAEAIRDQFHAENEVYQISTLLSVQIVLLQDVRFHLQNIEDLLRNRLA